jgi:anti-sigma factor RsiW
MAAPLTHREIEELLGAYALDAVDGSEAEQVADHLPDCARCRAEVAEHREVAALLAQGGSPAPAELWDRIAASIEGSGPSDQERLLVAPPLFSRPREGAGRRPWRNRATLAVAAVAAAVSAVLGVQVVGQGNKIDEQGEELARMAEEDGLSNAFRSAIEDPEAELVALRSADGEREAKAVMTGSTGFLHAGALPELPEGRTYQLWGDVGDRRISLGVLGNRPSVASFAVSGQIVALAITEEEGAGVVVSEQAPVVFAIMPTDA